MAENELSLSSIFQDTPEPDQAMAVTPDEIPERLAADQDIQSLPGFTAPGEYDPEMSIAAALGEAPEQGPTGFEAYDIQQRYKSLPRKALEAFGYVEGKLAEQAIKVAPQIKDAAIDIADSLGVDTSEWNPVDLEKWRVYLKAPEVHFHDITNLLIDKEHKKSRMLVGLASDIFLDPTTYIGNIGGLTAKGAQALKTLEAGQDIAKLSTRLKTGEAALAQFGIGKASVRTPGIVNRAAGEALDIAEDLTSRALDVADKYTNGQARRGLYNVLTSTNDPLIGQKIKTLNAKTVADDIEIGRFNDKYRPIVAEMSEPDKAAFRDWLEKPYDVVATSDSGLGALKTDIEFKAFPVSEKYRELADDIRSRLYQRNKELAELVGAVDKTGRPTIGWTAIKEAIDEDDILTRPTSYFPRQVAPEFKQFLKENGLTDSEIQKTVPIFTDASRRQRSYRDVLATEAEALETKRINSLLEGRVDANGNPMAYSGRVYESDPLNNIVRYDAMARQHANKLRLEKDLVERSIDEEAFKAMSEAERVKWQRFDAGSDVVSSKNPFVIGKKMHGRYLRQGDADRARYALQLKPDDAFDSATKAIAMATRFYRQAALLSPKYFTGNLVGNFQNSLVVSPNRKGLFSDYAKAFGVIKDFSRGGDGVHNVAGELMSTNKLIEEMAGSGIWDAGKAAEFYENVRGVGETVADTIEASKNLYSNLGKMPRPWNIFKFNQEFTNMYADNLGKVALYLNFRNAGYSKASAAKMVEEALFNFSDVSPALRQARRVAPFITYPIKMVPFAAKSIAKYPWLPELVDRSVELAISNNMDISPMETQVVKDLAPIYYRQLFNPIISNVLPGNNLVLSDLQSPISTINNVLSLRTPGLMQTFLMAYGISPESMQRVQQTDFADSIEGEGMLDGVKTIGSALFMDPMPKPIKAMLSVGTGGFVDNPYAAKVNDRVSKYRMTVDESDRELGEHITTHGFMRKFMPDFFEEQIVKKNPEFFRKVGSVARQHLKDVTFGLATMTPLDGEMLMRRMAIINEREKQRNKIKAIVLSRDAAQDDSLRKNEEDTANANIEVLERQLTNLGIQYDMIDNLSRKYRTRIQEDFTPE